jgi:catechol 2,3-dioxygenase-like lactoylglutathione lyase family enzyme
MSKEEHQQAPPPAPSAPGIFDPARLYHVAICVHSVAETAHFYEEKFGIGPFWFRDVDYPTATFHGEVAGYRGRRGFAQLGPLLLELVEPVAGRTIHEPFLKEKGEGLHHLGFEVDNLSEAIAEAEQRGFRMTQTFRRPDGSGFAYFDSDTIGGTVFEIVEKPRQKG